jgi:hypothetical protein
LNQWAKLKARYTSRREGWPVELLGNIAIGSVIAYLHSNKYRLEDPSPPERRYYDDFDAEMAKEGRPKECRCCSCVLDDFGGEADIPEVPVASSYLGSILQLKAPLCAHCAFLLKVTIELDQPDGTPLGGGWVERVLRDRREKHAEEGEACAAFTGADQGWANQGENYVRATDAESDDEEGEEINGEGGADGAGGGGGGVGGEEQYSTAAMAECMGECDEDAVPTARDIQNVRDQMPSSSKTQRMARMARGRGDDS